MADIKYIIAVDSTEATKKVEDFDKSIDDAAKTSDVAEKSHKGLWAQVALGQFAYDAAVKAGKLFIGFMKDSITAAMDSEKSEKALSAALEITGRPVKALSEHFKDFASAMQKATIYEDDTVTSSQALLVQLTNLDRDGIDRATKGAIGLASVFGMDLESATQLVAKSMNGNAAMLGRYGIKVEETTDKEKQRTQILDKLEQFYGRATTETGTLSGQLSQMGNIYNNLQETVGGYIVKNYALRDALKALGTGLDAWLTSGEREEKQRARQNEIDNEHIDIVYKALRAGGATIEQAQKVIELGYKNIYEVEQAIQANKYGTAVIIAFNKEKEKAAKIAVDLAAAELAASRGTNTFAESTDKAAAAALKEKNALFNLNKATDDYRKDVVTLNKIVGALKTTEFELTAGFNMGTVATDKNTFSLNQNKSSLSSLGVVSSAVAKKVGKDWQAELQKIIDISDRVVGTFTTAFDLITAASQQGYTNRQIQMDNDYQIALDKLKKKKDMGLITETEYNDGLEKLDKMYADKSKVLKREMGESQKKTAIIQALISTYQAVAQTFSTLGWPWGIIPAGIMLKLGLDNVNKIRQQPIPLAKGAIFKQPTILPGMNGQNYEVAEPGSGGVEIVATPANIRKAISLDGGRGKQPITLVIHNYIAGQKVQEQVIRIIEDASQTGKLRISAKAIA
jgi:hypothetical protein